MVKDIEKDSLHTHIKHITTENPCPNMGYYIFSIAVLLGWLLILAFIVSHIFDKNKPKKRRIR